MRLSRIRAAVGSAFLLGAACGGPSDPAPPAAPSAPAAPEPVTGPADLSISCDKTSFDLDEAPVSATCTVRPSNRFRGTVRLSCAGAPGEVTCAFVPSEINITGDTGVSSALQLSRTIMADPGRTVFQARAEGGGLARSAELSVYVTEGCSGFFTRASYGGNCSDGAPHWRCISFSDGYKWHLIPVADIRGYTTQTCFGMTVETTDNAGPVRYRHVLGTNLITTVGSIFR